jgi:hypothetical protein
MKLMILFALLVASNSVFAQGYIATAPQSRGYYQPQYQQPPQYYPPAPVENYPTPQCPNDGYQQQAGGLDGLKHACAQWENHPHRRTGQLAEMKIKLICRQAVIVSARVETKTIPAYDVTSAPTPTEKPWVKEVTCSQVAQAQYNIVQLCGVEEENPNYPPPPK